MKAASDEADKICRPLNPVAYATSRRARSTSPLKKTRTVDHDVAKAIKRDGIPELQQKVADGEVSLNAVEAIDEVKDIRGKYTAMAEYAKQAKDKSAISLITILKLRVKIRKKGR